MPAIKVVPVRECRKHLEEAYVNYQRYLRFLQEPENFDWAIVLLFYSALHLVQAHAVSKSKHFCGVNPVFLPIEATTPDWRKLNDRLARRIILKIRNLI